jgi:ParB-like chromosome segregation protein Spo0J
MTVLKLDSINLDGGTQSRASLDETAIKDYADAYLAGRELPKPVVFSDGSTYWLASGFHRFHAARTAGLVELECNVTVGTRREAVLFSVGENQKHGVRRTNADKAKCVQLVLADAEWSQWTDRRIAEVCGVTHPFVAALRNPERKEAQKTAREKLQGKEAPSPAPSGKEPPVYVESVTTHDVKSDVLHNSGAEKEPDPADLTDKDLYALLEEVQAENAQLREDLKALEATDTGKEVMKWRQIADAAKRGQDDAMERAAKAVVREKWAMRQLQRCGRAVGEDNPEHIAAKVEAMARATRGKVAA